jgi:hypothetical protein
LLLLLEGNEYAIKYNKKWYEERMEVLESYKEKEIIRNKMNDTMISKVKIKKF